MAQEAKVRVRIDTRKAKADLRGLNRVASGVAGRVGSGLRNIVGRGFRAAGLGAGIGVGVQAVRGATQSGFGDVIGEAFGSIGAQISHAILGDMPEEARAAKFAREQTIQAFGAVAGQTGRIPPGARNFFSQVRALRLQEEKGRTMFERDGDFFGPKAGDIIKRITNAIRELLSEAVDNLISRIIHLGGH